MARVPRSSLASRAFPSAPAALLAGPLVVLDTVSAPWPPVVLRWPAGVRSPSEYRSDAEQAFLAARAETCRRETPQHACDNLLELGLRRSFAVDAGPVQRQGRWWRFARSDGAVTVSGELSLAVKSGASWRLADNAITLRDEADGRERTPRFDRVDIAFRDGIAIDTPLHLDRGAGAGPTEVPIETRLPGDVPDFEVRLSALQIGSASREIAPIRFERRRFDGGVEPLNC